MMEAPWEAKVESGPPHGPRRRTIAHRTGAAIDRAFGAWLSTMRGRS